MFAVFSSLFQTSGGRFGRFSTFAASTVKQKIAQNGLPKLGKTTKTQQTHNMQVRFFELHFDLNVFSVEKRRLFSIVFQLHTNSHVPLWLPMVYLQLCLYPRVYCTDHASNPSDQSELSLQQFPPCVCSRDLP